MPVRLIGLEEETDWRAALSGLPYGIAHDPGFLRIVTGPAASSTSLAVYECERGRAVCPITERAYRGYPDIVTPYGFGGFVGAGDLSGLPDAWNVLVRDREYVAAYLMQNPLLMPPQVAGFWQKDLTQVRTLFSLDLMLPEEERLSRVSRRKRSQLKRWIEDARIEHDQATLAAAFVDLYPAFAARQGVGPAYQLSTDQLNDLVSLPQTLLVGVRGEDGDISSVALMSTYGACGDYLYMAARPDGAVDGSGVVWLGAQALANRGVRRCNLGGGISEGDGVAEMKRRLGGEPVSIPVFRSIYRADAYKHLCEQANVDMEGPYFPAYHAPSE